MTLYLIYQSLSEMDDSVYEDATERREGSYWSQKHVLSLDILREPLLKFLALSENEPLPYLPNLTEMDNSV